MAFMDLFKKHCADCGAVIIGNSYSLGKSVYCENCFNGTDKNAVEDFSIKEEPVLIDSPDNIPSQNASLAYEPEAVIDDITYIREMRHSETSPWHKYDILIAAQPYSWKYMLECASYMARADLDDIETLIATQKDGNSNELVNNYRNNGGNIDELFDTNKEYSLLSLGGFSRVLNGSPVKIVWLNDTNILRIFSLVGDKDTMTRYTETLIRRSFGTPDAMKLAKAIPEKM